MPEMSRRSFTLVLVTALLAPMLVGATARADERERCASASETAQHLRNQTKLRAARAELLQCARRVCPAIVRNDCEHWLAEIDAELPTVIFAAQDEAGRDLVDVRVIVDGAMTKEALDGKAVAIDPGSHVVRYERGGGGSTEEKIVINQGEKNRVLATRFVRPATPEATPPHETSTSTPTPTSTFTPGVERSLPTGFYVAGAVGLVSLGAFTVLSIKGQSDYDACRHASVCTASDADTVKVERALAWTTFAVGTLAAAAAAWFFVTAPSEAHSAARVQVLAVRGGGFVGLETTVW
jgi:hypothetical protein